ncbi:radical SAM protein [Methanothermobacter sp.]|uniref:radical SAM protein n=1 Tax=Methanothermobacter sp. TaxID=1884223 RepID=UPI003C737446
MFRILQDRCTGCGRCRMLQCSENCSGCGACQLVCPEGALVPGGRDDTEYRVKVNSEDVRATGTVGDALEAAGIRVSGIPGEGEVFSPCGTGGCWACAVSANGMSLQSCVTPLEEGMVIETIPEPPLRYVGNFGPHTAGGVGTPLSERGEGPVEVVCFAHGCNLRCPQCQNSQVAFTRGVTLLDPEETAMMLLGVESIYRTGTVTFSGGECTLNRSWLSGSVRRVRELDGGINIHVDTNGTVLTPPYIDELAEAGMNRIGIDIKGRRLKTFMGITGLSDPEKARVYLENSWNAFSYISEEHHGIFMGLGVPYNSALISTREIAEMASEIVSVSADVQVTLLDYRPEFRLKDIQRPSVPEMLEVRDLMLDEGLRRVIVQTSSGFIG